MSRVLPWNDLQVVLAVADGGAVAAAARALGVNHTTVLRRVAALEQRLGVRLFERLPTGYTLTTAGEELVRGARRIDATVVELERRVLGQDLRLAGTVRVTTTDTLAASILPPHLQSFRAAHPALELELITVNALLNLTRREADVAIRPSKTPPENLHGRRIAEVAFAPYASPPYLARRPATTALEEHAWIAPDDSLRETSVARWMARALPGAAPALRADSLVAMREAAAAGLGVAALPCYLGDLDARLARVRAPIAEMSTALWVLVHRDLRRAARVRAFVDHVVAGLAGDRDLVEGRRPRPVRARR